MTRTRRCRPLARLCVAIVMAGAAAGLAQAATLRIASAFDPQTMDPHAVALPYPTRVVQQIRASSSTTARPSVPTTWCSR